MPVWVFVLDALGVLLALLLIGVLALILRRRWLSRSGGTFEASVRVRSSKIGRGWVLGIGRYTGEHLEWFRVFSWSPRPKQVFARWGFEVMSRRMPSGPEAFALYAGHVILDCQTQAGRIELAMSEDSLTGFLAWLEAAPPGRTRIVS
jgi:hypothetical protein